LDKVLAHLLVVIKVDLLGVTTKDLNLVVIKEGQDLPQIILAHHLVIQEINLGVTREVDLEDHLEVDLEDHLVEVVQEVQDPLAMDSDLLAMASDPLIHLEMIPLDLLTMGAHQIHLDLALHHLIHLDHLDQEVHLDPLDQETLLDLLEQEVHLDLIPLDQIHLAHLGQGVHLDLIPLDQIHLAHLDQGVHLDPVHPQILLDLIPLVQEDPQIPLVQIPLVHQEDQMTNLDQILSYHLI